jgi:hypothetical protein
MELFPAEYHGKMVQIVLLADAMILVQELELILATPLK